MATAPREATCWKDRAKMLSESTRALLLAAVHVSIDGDKAAQKLDKCAAHFDTVAASLQEDLLTLSADVSVPAASSGSARRAAVARMLGAALGDSDAQAPERPSKRARS
jgi:hypothetical protein